METQICSPYDPPTMVERTIKIERDEDRDSDDESEIPCVSTVPIPADKNTGSYYYPSQAVVAPRAPMFTTINRLAQKRKTIQAMAQAALMTAEEPIPFEETLWCNNAKIVLYDTQTKREVPRDHLGKTAGQTSSAQSSQTSTTMSTVSVAATRELTTPPDKALLIDKSYSLRHKSDGATIQPERETGLSTTTASITSSYNTTSFPAETVSTAGTSSAVATTTLSTRPAAQSQPAKPNPPATSSLTRRTSLLNSLPSERIEARKEAAKNLAEKTYARQTAYKPLAMASTASIRPETASKTAVCLPNTTKSTGSSASRAIYVPREINLGATELRLEDCINVKEICDKELTKWTAEDVAKFVRATDCSEYAHVFIDQEIDGKALTLLNQDFLIQWMKLKLGPAMKLNCHIINLKHSLNA